MGVEEYVAGAVGLFTFCIVDVFIGPDFGAGEDVFEGKGGIVGASVF